MSDLFGSVQAFAALVSSALVSIVCLSMWLYLTLKYALYKPSSWQRARNPKVRSNPLLMYVVGSIGLLYSPYLEAHDATDLYRFVHDPSCRQALSLSESTLVGACRVEPMQISRVFNGRRRGGGTDISIVFAGHEGYGKVAVTSTGGIPPDAAASPADLAVIVQVFDGRVIKGKTPQGSFTTENSPADLPAGALLTSFAFGFFVMLSLLLKSP